MVQKLTTSHHKLSQAEYDSQWYKNALEISNFLPQVQSLVERNERTATLR